MKLEVFNVEHGACALLSCDDGTLIAIDCGHNNGTGWTLDQHLLARGRGYLDELWITNLDQDHLSGLVPLWSSITIGNIRINPSLTARDLLRLKYIGGTPTDDIKLLCHLMQTGFVNRPMPLPTTEISAVSAWNTFGRFEDTNNLSMAVVVTTCGMRVFFPGDLEKAGMENLLWLPAPFGDLVRDIDLLVAPHHGRVNGQCQRLFDAQTFGKPMACIVSDGSIKHDSQVTDDWYRQRVGGIVLTNNTPRFVLTTRSDGNITVGVRSDQPGWFTVQTERQSALQQTRLAPAPRGLGGLFASGSLGLGR